jgi:hypothetical protein
MAQKLNPNQQKVSDFLVKIVTDLLKEQGVRVGVSDIGVLSAGKNLSPKDCLPVLQAAFLRLVADHPELAEMLLAGATDAVKERIRKACSL